MGAKKESKNSDGGNKEESSTPVVLKVDMHCQGCASKITRRVRGFQGSPNLPCFRFLLSLPSQYLSIFLELCPVILLLRNEFKTYSSGILFPLTDIFSLSSSYASFLRFVNTTEALKLRIVVEGVEAVKTESGANKLTIIGKLDPSKLRDKLAEKTKKKVELISPQPKKETKDSKADNKKSDDKSEKKADDKKAKEVRPPVTTF